MKEILLLPTFYFALIAVAAYACGYYVHEEMKCTEKSGVYVRGMMSMKCIRVEEVK